MSELSILGEAIERQKKHVDAWRQPSEPRLFETLRAIDKLHMVDLFDSVRSTAPREPQHSLASWGINKALERILPPAMTHGPFQLFRSTAQSQAQADEFLFQCGVLHRAELLHGWLREGLLSAALRTLRQPTSTGIEKILVLKTADPSLFSEVVSQRHREWMSDLTMELESAHESKLEDRHLAIEPELEKRVRALDGWSIEYSTTPEIDEHFLEWGQHYLRRMWSGDLLDVEDKIGGHQFNEYLGVLAALSGRAQKHLCFAHLLKRRHPDLDFRNLLTTYAPCGEFLVSLAKHLDADTLHVQKLLASLTLEPANLKAHTVSGDAVWAPIVRSSANHYVLPLYGLDINPFLFLLRDLQAKYPNDWSRLANNREARWQKELSPIFPPPRWEVCRRSLALRDGTATRTDVDFVVYDSASNELGVFQLKWQQPTWFDNRSRRSAGKNLLTESNRWVLAVQKWIANHGAAELGRRAGISVKPGVTIHLFVVARYNAFFSGYGARNDSASWADWSHFLKARIEQPDAALSDLARTLTAEATEIAGSFRGESYALPMGNLAVILNPSSEPSSD
jgi:hypothetical protein